MSWMHLMVRKRYIYAGKMVKIIVKIFYFILLLYFYNYAKKEKKKKKKIEN